MKYESKKDCQFYKSESDNYGCTALNRLYCKIEDKPCSFFKPKEEEPKEKTEDMK